jgi:hypothetical protein
MAERPIGKENEK